MGNSVRALIIENRRITGLTAVVIAELAEGVGPLWQERHRSRLAARLRKRAVGAGAKLRLVFVDRLLATLVHLRDGVTHDVLARWFGVVRSTVTWAIGEVRSLLAERGCTGRRPPRRERNDRHRRRHRDPGLLARHRTQGSTGSRPLVRRERGGSGVVGRVYRITSARAERTRPGTRRASAPTVHLRSCGGEPHSRQQPSFFESCSPRVRETLRATPSARWPPRGTLAPAGPFPIPLAGALGPAKEGACRV
ncbi:helix-turn-helix domain-containing protein [Streptomyces brasiliscabiei]|uniref:helix-turn-helix domain-containing protein n=1 Tax=Streptomyces brasiliscabiei TaxID=2736302 RepID=UPI003F6825A1